MKIRNKLNAVRVRRAIRVRAKLTGTAVQPRLAVYRSNRGIYAQLINDELQRTLTAASARELESANKAKKKSDQARAVGELLAERALKLGVKKAVLDRRNYRYHGRVRALTEGARQRGLQM